MKRGGPLPRNKPLDRSGQLKRTPLASVTPIGGKAERKPVRDTGPCKSVRGIVYVRCGATDGLDGHPGICEWPGCHGRRVDLQHRLGRKSGGRHGEAHERINTAAWLIATCREHHRQVTSPYGAARKLAQDMGWLLEEHQDAHEVPVLTRHAPVLVLLDDEGGWRAA